MLEAAVDIILNNCHFKTSHVFTNKNTTENVVEMKNNLSAIREIEYASGDI